MVKTCDLLKEKVCGPSEAMAFCLLVEIVSDLVEVMVCDLLEVKSGALEG